MRFFNPQVKTLMYHNVIPDSSANIWDVSIDNFEKQMTYLFKRRYNIISLDDLCSYIYGKKKLISHSVVITFDDGMKGIYEHAFPVIKKYNFTATVFLISDFIGKKIIKNQETKEYLNYNEIKEMYKYGIQFGSHTLDHRVLTKLPLPEAKYQIEESRKRLIESLRIDINYFCYPGGYFNEEIKKLVKEAGYKGICSTFGYGSNNKEPDLFQLERILIRQSDNLFSFWLKLSKMYDWIDSLRRWKNTL